MKHFTIPKDCLTDVEAIGALVAAATETGEKLCCTISGLQAIAMPGDDPVALLKIYQLASRYPKAWDSNEVYAPDLDALNKQLRIQMQNIEQLDYDNPAMLLSWLLALHLPSLFSRVAIPRQRIRRAFTKHGFAAQRPTKVNCNDHNAWGRSLVTWAIDDLGTPYRSLQPEWVVEVYEWFKKRA